MRPEYQNLINRIEELGYYAKFRQWSMGDTILVAFAAPKASMHSEIKTLERMFYLKQRTDGEWFSSYSGEENIREGMTINEVILFVERMMTIGEDAFSEEWKQRLQIGAIVQAHKHCSDHYDEIMASELCGCFYCLATFAPDQIVDWHGREQAKTYAVCPSCGIDSVIGSESRFPITQDFLSQMRLYWF